MAPINKPSQARGCSHHLLWAYTRLHSRVQFCSSELIYCANTTLNNLLTCKRRTCSGSRKQCKVAQQPSHFISKPGDQRTCQASATCQRSGATCVCFALRRRTMHNSWRHGPRPYNALRGVCSHPMTWYSALLSQTIEEPQWWPKECVVRLHVDRNRQKEAVLLYLVLVLVLKLYLSTFFGYWYWYWYLYLPAKYWYLYWYL